MKLELLEWGHGSIRLTHWDYMYEDDTIFILDESGTAYIEKDGLRVPVNLTLALRELWKRRYG